MSTLCVVSHDDHNPDHVRNNIVYSKNVAPWCSVRPSWHQRHRYIHQVGDLCQTKLHLEVTVAVKASHPWINVLITWSWLLLVYTIESISLVTGPTDSIPWDQTLTVSFPPRLMCRHLEPYYVLASGLRSFFFHWKFSDFSIIDSMWFSLTCIPMWLLSPLDLRPRNGVLAGYWSCKFPTRVVIIPQNDGDVSLYGANVWLVHRQDQVLSEYIYMTIFSILFTPLTLLRCLSQTTQPQILLSTLSSAVSIHCKK